MQRPTADEKREANLKRREEYATIRERLLTIATAPESSDYNEEVRVNAAMLLYEIDRDGAPPAYRW